MKIETKYDIGQEVWFVDEECPRTAQIEAFDYAEGIGVVYLIRLLDAETLAFCVRSESELFPTKEELLKSLLSMEELERLLKLRKCHFELYYSSIMDFCIKLYLKGFNDDDSDLIIFEEQNSDLDYLVSKCKVAYKDWLIENNNGY